MKRRTFLQCLGAFAAAAFLPSCGRSIVRAPAWWKGEVIVFKSWEPLIKGTYTFTAYMGDLGMYFGGVKALGGETYFEMPTPQAGYRYENPRIKLGGITINRSTDFCDAQTRDALLRSDAVTKEG